MIRQLMDSETPPSGEPRRYVQGSGYVVLRWKIGPYSYVERREHRHMMIQRGHDIRGRHVHHINGVRSDNRPENLIVLGSSEHHAEHRAVDRKRAVALYQSGLTTAEVANEVGCTPGAVSRFLADAGVKARPPQGVSLPQARIRALYLKGYSPAAIARQLGVPNVAAIRRRVKDMGLPPRRAGRYSDQGKECSTNGRSQ